MAPNSTRRKLAIATWSRPTEGNIYGKMTVDCSAALRYIAALRESSGEKVTMTHLVIKAVGEALKQVPTMNGRIVFGRYVPFDTVDVSCLVALQEGADLAKVKVCDVDKKSVVDIAKELRARAEKLIAGKDDDFEKSKGVLRALPTWLLKPLIWAVGWLSSALGASIPALGVEPFPFGSCIITSVGMLGVDEGYAPPTPFARTPLLVLIGAVADRPAVVDGELAITPQMILTATIDHRFMDGFQGGTLVRIMRQVMADPARLDA